MLHPIHMLYIYPSLIWSPYPVRVVIIATRFLENTEMLVVEHLLLGISSTAWFRAIIFYPQKVHYCQRHKEMSEKILQPILYIRNQRKFLIAVWTPCEIFSRELVILFTVWGYSGKKEKCSENNILTIDVCLLTCRWGEVKLRIKKCFYRRS